MRRFNYTGRKKILSEDVHITLKSKEEETPVIDINVNLADYDFTDAEVILEAQRMTRHQRLFLGNIANKQFRKVAQQLDQFDDAQGLQFKIKVKDSGGKLLGYAEKIKPYLLDTESDQFNTSILQVRSIDLSKSGELWRVVSDDDSYVLEIERALGNREQVVRSLLFKGFILPTAMRIILENILSSDDWDDELTDISSEADKWMLFASRLMGGLIPDKDEESKSIWIDGAIKVLVSNIGSRETVINEFSLGRLM